MPKSCCVWLSAALLLLSFNATAQQFSENGWHLPPNGFIRVLLIYAEIDYDVHPQWDPHKQQGRHNWKLHQLPDYHAELFDPNPNAANPRGMVTQFFDEASFGSYTVCGDYLRQVVTVKESEMERYGKSAYLDQVIATANKRGKLQTMHGFAIEDFDNLTVTKAGQKKIQPSIDSPARYDHIMICFRNLHLENTNSGWANLSNLPELFGHKSDTYSVFRVGGQTPFYIARHEFGHLLFGGNNFHVGGGQHSGGGGNHFISTQGGWSILGGANSSFQTCNAWDRDRMGWKGPGKTLSISALNASGQELNTDFEASTWYGQEVEVTLRDWVTTGDAVRIQLPGIPEDEYQQYIWLENHQGFQNNGSAFDRFQYQDNPCVDLPTPGIYMYLQVHKDEKQGKSIYTGWGDFLHPIPAEGFYDYQWDAETVENTCINNGQFPPFEKRKRFANPLTGAHDMEFPTEDTNGDGQITRKDGYITAIERVNGQLQFKYPQLGDARDAFTVKGVNRINSSTNPSTNSMMTLASLDRAYHKGKAPDNRSVYLSGIDIELMEEKAGGAIVVRIKWQRSWNIEEDVRWCASDIHWLGDAEAGGIAVGERVQVTLDRGTTATDIRNPETIDSKAVFTQPTRFTVDAGNIQLYRKAKLRLKEASELHLKSGVYAHCEHKSHIELQDSSMLRIEAANSIVLSSKSRCTMQSGTVLMLRLNSSEHRPVDGWTDKAIVEAAFAHSRLRKGSFSSIEELEGGWVRAIVGKSLVVKSKPGAVSGWSLPPND